MPSINDAFAQPTDILSRWKLEGNFNVDAVDAGSYGNDLNRIGDLGNHWNQIPGLSAVYTQARVLNNVGTGTNVKFTGLNAGNQYAGDAAKNFSFWGWVYPSGANQGEDQKIFINQDKDKTISLGTRWMMELKNVGGGASTRLQFAYNDDPGGALNNVKYIATAAATVITSGQWNHVGATYDNDGGVATLYLNGEPLASGAITGVTGSGAVDDLALGGAANAGLNDFDGALQDWVFVPRAMGSGEMSALKTVGTPTSGYIGGYVPAIERLFYANDEEMQGVWLFNESASLDTKQDSSGKGNHLDKIIGTPTHQVAKFANGIEFKHWNEPYPRVARASSGCSAGLNPATTSWTFGGWLKPSGGAYETYAHIGGKGGYDQYVLYIDEEMDLWAQVRIDGIRYALHSGRVSGLAQDQWNHVDWVVDRTNGFHELYRTPDDGICAPILLDRQSIPSGTENQDTSTEPFYFGASTINQEPIDAQLDEWYFRSEALNTTQIRSICLLGLPTKTATANSGYIGGYLDAIDSGSVTAASGYMGGYLYSVAQEASGYLGGFLYQTSSITSASGYAGGYLCTPSFPSGYIGGYLPVFIPSSGYIGGYVFGRDNTSGTWLAYFDFSTTQNLDFDSIARVGDAENLDFDATCTVARVINPPSTTFAINGVSIAASGYEIMFSGVATVADATLPDGRTNVIDSAYIKWGDFSGVMANVNPYTGAWAAKHLYTTSGVYMPRIDVVDINGAHGSNHGKVDLSVGAPNPITLQLTATPSTGNRPLAAAFTNTYVTQFAGSVESVTDFGDRTITHLENATHVYRYMGNYTPIWIVKDDRGRFWNDSTSVGVNN
jgi:uncharacterized Zn-binding protein involved in type VI secretion